MLLSVGDKNPQMSLSRGVVLSQSTFCLVIFFLFNYLSLRINHNQILIFTIEFYIKLGTCHLLSAAFVKQHFDFC